MDEVDNEARMAELRLELANLKQGDTENIAEFVSRADVLAKEPPDSQVDIGMAVARGILDLDHKEKLLFECARSKSFTFSTVKTLIKALYFSRGKDNPFDQSYRELRSVSFLPSPIQSTEELVRQCIPALVQGVRTLNSSSNHPAPYQQPASSSFESGKQRSYRERNPNNNRCYICNDPGHYAHQCPRKGTQRPLLSSTVTNDIPKHQITHLTTLQFNNLSMRPLNLYLYQKFAPY